MNGLGIRIYTDEDVDVNLASRLLARGYDAISTRDAGNAHLGLEDHAQLEYAASIGRAILTHNVGHFMNLHKLWKSQGLKHNGIIMVRHIPIGELVRRTRLHLDIRSPEEQYNQVLFLPQ